MEVYISIYTLNIPKIRKDRNWKIITNKFMESGEHSFDFDATNLPSGMYFVRLKAESKILTEKHIISM